NPRHVLVADILRFIGHLMVVGVTASGEENHGNVVPRVVRMIAAAIDVLRVAVGVHAVVERERHLFGLVHRLGDIAKFGREATGTHQLDIIGTAVKHDGILALAGYVGDLTAPDHVD